MRAVNFILRLVVGGVFVAAGTLKIWDPSGFANDIANYRLLPDALVNLVAITLPSIEVLAGSLLMAGLWKKPSALLITGLMAVFLVGIVQAVVRHLDIHCGCFSSHEARHVGLIALAQDLTLFCAAAWLTFWYKD